MRLIGLAVIVILGLSLAPLAVEAQQAEKLPRIAFLAGGARVTDALLIETFWRRMKELGYFEGKNIIAEYRFAEGAPERLQSFAAELEESRVAPFALLAPSPLRRLTLSQDRVRPPR